MYYSVYIFCRFVSFNCKKDTVSKPTGIDTLFHDGSVVRKLQSLSLDYNDVKESLSDGKLMLDCVSQDVHSKIKELEKDFQNEIQNLRGGKDLFNLANSFKNSTERQSVKEKAMNAPVDIRTPLQKKRGRKRAIKEEEIEIKAAELLPGSDGNSYIPFPKS